MEDWLREARDYPLKRGLTHDDMARHQCQLVENPTAEQLRQWLQMDLTGFPEAVWVIPNLYGSNGDIQVHNYAVRCFPPFPGCKFISTKGISARPYMLPGNQDKAADLDTPIVICEKQMVVMLLSKLGYCGIALDGTFGAAEKRDSTSERLRLHPALKEFDWVGREVFLAFDSDYLKRQNVLQGLIRTWFLFSAQGAMVRLLSWDPAYTGLDDYIAAQSLDDVELQKF